MKRLPENEDWSEAQNMLAEQLQDEPDEDEDECPEGGDHDYKYQRGYAQTLETPAELAGWECTKCGVWKQE